MNWIDTNEIREWAGSRDCQETLPLLIKRLIRATAPAIQAIKFPSGNNVAHGGLDGILEAAVGTEYIPEGKSVWECGANKDAKRKADDDYKKRKKDASVDVTYVCVTPRLWGNGEEWAEERRNEKIWKNVKVINAEVLEEWLEQAPSVGSWLAMHIGKIPEGVQATEDFWNEWSSGPKKLQPSILLGGRDAEVAALHKLIEVPALVGLLGTSREEALAFSVACFKNSPDKQEDFFSRSIIIDSPEVFRRISILKTPLILIPRFDDTTVMNKAVANGHTVIAPLDPGANTKNWTNVVKLPRLDRGLFVKSLINMGFERDQAEFYSKESTRNISILRRQLKIAGHMPEWAKPENVRDLIPAMLAGRWDENLEGDKKIIADLAGESYDSYSQKLTRWLNAPDSPLYKIGTAWRLASPSDAWTNAGINLTGADFEKLRVAFLQALSEVHPAFALKPEERLMASLKGIRPIHSNWIREGTTQSLILVSLFGSQLKFPTPAVADQWVDQIVAELLESNDPYFWKTLDHQMPLVAEASPASFIANIETHIAAKDSPIISLFTGDPGLLMDQSYHTGLLWALEGLAWMPEYLAKSTLLLAKLAANDPGGNLANRPINSLNEIFKPWHFQTFANFQDRMDVLSLIVKTEKEIAWTLLIRMLPEGMNGTGSFTHKMKWRLSDRIIEKSVKWKEIWDTHSHVVDLLLSIYDFSEEKLASVLNKSAHLDPLDRQKLFDFIKDNIEKIKQTEYSAWHVVRKIINSHRTYPTAEWALRPEELAKFEELEELLKPTDELNKYVWLFNDHWPSFPEENAGKRLEHNEMHELIERKRAEGLKSIFEKFGIVKIKELAATVKESWALGSALATILEDEVEIQNICPLLNEDPDSRFIWGFLYKKSILKGIEWTLKLYEYLVAQGYSNQALAKMFAFSLPSKQLWDFIEKTNDEIEKTYWLKVNIHFYGMGKEERIHVVKKLISVNRFVSAMKICSLYLEEMPSELMVELLKKTATVPLGESIQMDGYDVERMFDAFYERKDVTEDQLANLEWLFLPVLSAPAYGDRKPQILHEELAKKSSFFVEAMKWAYKPDNDELIEEEKKELTTEQFDNRAGRAYDLLKSWKNIPGVAKDGEIDAGYLNAWINEVRELATLHSRIHIADSLIGKMLAQYPEKEGVAWPPLEICGIIERVNTKELKNNFSIGIFNKRGTYSKSPFAGGERERSIAKRFNDLAATHRNTSPNVAAILDGLAKSYERDALEEDDRAVKTSLDN